MLSGARRRPFRTRPAGAGRAAVLAAASIALLPVLALVAAPPARADSVRSAQQWVLDAMNVPAAWSASRGAGVTVAVIDSGVDGAVSDLAGSVTGGPDYTGVHTSPGNPNWGMHGTWMASLIAGHGHDGGSGILGTAPDSRVLSIRVITDRLDPGYAAYEKQSLSRGQQELARGIRYAVRRGVGVISMSLGYGAPSRVVRAALQDAYAHNVVVVASSGNYGTTADQSGRGSAPYSFPADYPGVLGVAAVGQDWQPASFSSDNLSVQVAAPGVRVPAQGRDGQYWLVSGTSPACALTAGVAALIKARYRGLPAAQVINAITSTTWHKPPGGYDKQVGFGTVDAAAALAAAGRLAGRAQASRTVSAASHFGGGSAAVPSSPVQPRGPLALVLYCLLGAACLALIGVAAMRLVAFRQQVPAGGSWPPDPVPPTPGWGLLPRGEDDIGGASPPAAGPAAGGLYDGWPADSWAADQPPADYHPADYHPADYDSGDYGPAGDGSAGAGPADDGPADDGPGCGSPTGFARLPWQAPSAGRHAAPPDRSGGPGGRP
jgi:hypothetical protein